MNCASRSFAIAVSLVTGFVFTLPAQVIHSKYDSIRTEASYETDTSNVAPHIVSFAIGFVEYADTVEDSIGSVTVRDTLLDFQKEDSTDHRSAEHDSTLYRLHPMIFVYLQFFATVSSIQDGLGDVGDVAILCADGTRLRIDPADDVPDGTILLRVDLDDLRHLASGPAIGELGAVQFEISAAYAHTLASLLSKLQRA